MFPIFAVKIEGESGWPELVPGNYYLAASLLQPKIGDFIVFPNPQIPEKKFVKKIRKINGDFYDTAGTVPWSATSDDFGLINKKDVWGKIIGLSQSAARSKAKIYFHFSRANRLKRCHDNASN